MTVPLQATPQRHSERHRDRSATNDSRLKGIIFRTVDIRPDERRILLLSATYFFCLLCGYYTIRPVRDEMGIAEGVGNLWWLYLCTLAAMLAVNPFFSWLVSRTSRRVFIPRVYRFFALHLLVFFALAVTLRDPHPPAWLGYVFFVWVSVYNLFVVSVFWGFMADVFTNRQGKRLFGVVAVGGSIGAMAGSFIAWLITEGIPSGIEPSASSGSIQSVVLAPTNLLLVSALFLELATRCVGPIHRTSTTPGTAIANGLNSEQHPTPADQPITGNAWSGFLSTLRSPYLLGICLFLLMYSVSSTFLYFTQATIVEEAIVDRTQRVAFFAKVDFLTNLITAIVQVWLTGRIMRRWGVALTLMVLPLVTLAGFAVLALAFTLDMPGAMLWIVAVFYAARRASNFALSRPAREVLFTVVDREAKYKAKSLIDTFAYRAGDQVGAIGFTGLRYVVSRIGATVAVSNAILMAIMVPLALAWGVVAFFLAASRQSGAPAWLNTKNRGIGKRVQARCDS